MVKTLFEKILHGELGGEILYQDEALFVIKDKFPKAPVHLLIITKKVIPNLQSMEPDDYPLLQGIVRVAQELAVRFGIDESGYRLLVNNGTNGGQMIEHLHFHLLGGRPLGSEG